MTRGFVDKSVYKTQVLSTEKMRSAGFEPAIPSLGSSYLNRAGLTSLGIITGIVTKVSLYILSVPEIFNRHKKKLFEKQSIIIHDNIATICLPHPMILVLNKASRCGK